MIGEKKEGANRKGWGGGGGGGGGIYRGFTVSANYHVNYLGYRAS